MTQFKNICDKEAGKPLVPLVVEEQMFLRRRQRVRRTALGQHRPAPLRLATATVLPLHPPL